MFRLLLNVSATCKSSTGSKRSVSEIGHIFFEVRETINLIPLIILSQQHETYFAEYIKYMWFYKTMRNVISHYIKTVPHLVIYFTSTIPIHENTNFIILGKLRDVWN